MAISPALYIHGFNLLPQFGPIRLKRISVSFGSWQEAYEASQARLIKASIEPEIAKIFINHRQKLNLLQEQESLNSEGITLLTPQDPNYPRLLLEIDNSPPLLYVKGVMPIPNELCIAIVGTRKITNYGRAVAPELAEPLVDAGAVIVSGLAYGVDSAVQQVAVKKNRRTIAVLGGGLDDKSFYPKEHAWLAQEIINCGGALLSEYPIGTPPLKHHFVARNRIISGLSVATVVVECDLKSGSLITAKYALEQNRTVFAVPGPVYAPQSQGPNNLIKMGAKLITSAKDIFEDLNLKHLPEEQNAKKTFSDSPIESAVLKCLTREPVHINDILKQCGLSAGDVLSALTFLEMKGKIRNLGAQQYILSRI